jgi:DNA ligase-associated metallophosphoesterase
VIDGSAFHTVIADVDWVLLPQKCVYWPSEEILIISDAHIGKVTHFRKHGIAIPQKAEDQNFVQLTKVIEASRPKHIIWLGDLFHSKANNANDAFYEWREQHSDILMTLIIGNHDILDDDEYNRLNIKTVDSLELKGILFTHEPLHKNETDLYNIAGHIHAVVALSGKGGQYLNIPCFYFGKNQGIMPAFGSFTGGFKVSIKKNDVVFSITTKEVALVKYH